MLRYVLLFWISGLHWNFNDAPLGGLPTGWQTRGDSAASVYQIKIDVDGSRYLAARSHGSDTQLGIQVSASPQELPILSWRWRVLELPQNADERFLKTMDSAAAVYAVFSPRLVPRIIKYVWSTSVPAGTSFKHPKSGRMAIFVVSSGGQSLGQWQTVRRNLLEDYKQAFGSSPSSLVAIGVKTDSDSTNSSAQADYDDIQITHD
jgi:hypothetical protein